jgi:hypothetical protein
MGLKQETWAKTQGFVEENLYFFFQLFFFSEWIMTSSSVCNVMIFMKKFFAF